MTKFKLSSTLKSYFRNHIRPFVLRYPEFVWRFAGALEDLRREKNENPTRKLVIIPEPSQSLFSLDWFLWPKKGRDVCFLGYLFSSSEY
jgi:hypothetical protein